MSLRVKSKDEKGKVYPLPKTLEPFEVVNMGDGKVAVNKGTVLFDETGAQVTSLGFTGDHQPYDIVAGGANPETNFLTPEVGDYIVIYIESESSARECSLMPISPAGLNDRSGGDNYYIKLAYIKSQDENGWFEIENLYTAHFIKSINRYPPFTPFLFPNEKAKVLNSNISLKNETGVDSSVIWNCIFAPAHLYVANTMEESAAFHVESQTMLSFPIVQVNSGDTYSICFELDKNWNLKGTPTFLKNPECNLSPVKPNLCCGTGDPPCDVEDGVYRLKIVNFSTASHSDQYLAHEQYWRSDICIHGWGISQCSDDGGGGSGGSGSSDSGGSSGGDSGSDKSTAIVKAAWSPTDYTALFCLEAPEVRFEDIISARLNRFSNFIGVDKKFISVCERDSLSVVGYSCNKPISLGFSITDGVIIVKKPLQSLIYNNIDLKIKISGVRKGHGDKRFPTRTKKQYEENEKFLNSAYSK